MSHQRLVLTFLGAYLFFIAPAVAQNTPTIALPSPTVAPSFSTEPEIAIDELIRRALEVNPQLSVARETQEAARERIGAARANIGPSLQIVPGVGNRMARDEEIILSQPLDLFGRRRASAGVAEAQLRAAQAQSQLTERALIVAVKNAAADLYAAQEAETMAGVQVEVARTFHVAASRRAELGDVPPVQVQRADVEVLRAQNDLSGAQTERLARRATLNQLIGRAPDSPLRVALPVSTKLADLSMLQANSVISQLENLPTTRPAGDIPATPTPENAKVPVPANPSVAASSPVIGSSSPVIGSSSQLGSDLVAQRRQLLGGALQRPDIVGAQAVLEARRAQLEVLRSNRRPSVEIQARRSSATGPGSTALRAVVVVPLFDLGANKGERRALEAEVRSQEAQLALLRAQAATQIEQALLRLQQQRRMAERYRTGIVPQTLDLLRKTQIGYNQGASTYLEVIEAQRTLRQVQNEYLQALIGIRSAEASLESAFGADLPDAAALDAASPSPTDEKGGR